MIFFCHCLKGRVTVPKQINFRKSSKGGMGVNFNPKIYVGDFGPLNRAFRKKLHHDFPEIRGGGGAKDGLFQKFIRFGTVTRNLSAVCSLQYSEGKKQ